MGEELKECPYCNDKCGYYENLVMSYTQFYTFDHEPDGSDQTGICRGGKRIYCINCHRDLTKKIKRPVIDQ